MSTILVEPNPIRMEAPALPQAEPCVMVIFGATGDLTRRKLMPALWNLKGEGCLEGMRILGVGRTHMTDDEFRTMMHDALAESEDFDEEEWRKAAERIFYIAGELNEESTYQHTAQRLQEMANDGASSNHLFYLATPPSLAAAIVDGLGKAKLSQQDEHQDRKSTRLNSSHSQISYAVFCLKK